MDIAQLKILIDSDGTNAAKTDKEVLDWCNTPSVASEYATLTGSQLLAETDGTELEALTDSQKQTWLALCGVDTVPVQDGGAPAITGVALFGGPSTTVSNIVARRSYTTTPVQSVGLPKAREAHIIQARAL